MVAALAACAVGPDSSPSATPSVQQASEPAPSPVEVSLPPGVHRYQATELRPGDCIDPLPETSLVTVVPCDRPHVAEFATTYVIPDGPFPGAGDMQRLAEFGCTPRMRLVEKRKDEVIVSGLVPSEANWPRHRTIYCLAIAASRGSSLVGRVIL
ncbi:hypothetical protein GCM10009733_092550 [Nonomuraea maheshkhaliensis]|uniref:Septum formation-related domain-containing protein n=1 Tax=Nonomuraea maheshkhaliensis TaxID=419590 RepID=A0ABP4T3W2_9ACTN